MVYILYQFGKICSLKLYVNFLNKIVYKWKTSWFCFKNKMYSIS